MSNATVGVAGDASTTLVVAEKIARIRQLEEDVGELQASLDEGNILKTFFFKFI